MKHNIVNFFSPIFSLFWIAYLAVQLIVWHYPIRIDLLGFSPSLELIANFLCDMIWLPIAFFLPIYFSLLFASVTRWLLFKLVIYVFGLITLILGLLFLQTFFNYLVYIILPFFVFFIYSIFQKRKLRLYYYFFTLALILFSFHYQHQLFPKFHTSNSSNSLKLLSYNIRVNPSLEQRQKVARVILEQKPDIVFIQEITSGDRKLLRNLLVQEYPHQLWADRFENYNGGVIFSRIPFSYTDNINIKNSVTKSHTNMNHVTIKLNDKNIHLFNVHISHGASPFIRFLVGNQTMDSYLNETGKMFLRHNEEARDIINRVMSVDGAIILAGDMNDTPNSYVYRLFSKYLNNGYLLRVGVWEQHSDLFRLRIICPIG
jgi:endonuclease/exonuclease/phosphatase (EEP) superfamily protein YafD